MLVTLNSYKKSETAKTGNFAVRPPGGATGGPGTRWSLGVRSIKKGKISFNYFILKVLSTVSVQPVENRNVKLEYAFD